MAPRRERVLIVGIGNLLLSDEGLGVHVVGALLSGSTPLPPGVDVIDAGTSLLDVLPELARYERVIIVDAVRGGGQAGTVYRIDLRAELRSEAAPRVRLSLHQWETMDALRAAQTLGLLPREILLIGAEPARLDTGIGLSEALARAAERIVRMLIDLNRPAPVGRLP